MSRFFNRFRSALWILLNLVSMAVWATGPLTLLAEDPTDSPSGFPRTRASTTMRSGGSSAAARTANGQKQEKTEKASDDAAAENSGSATAPKGESKSSRNGLVKETSNNEAGLAPIVTADAARKARSTKAKSADAGKSNAPAVKQRQETPSSEAATRPSETSAASETDDLPPIVTPKTVGKTPGKKPGKMLPPKSRERAANLQVPPKPTSLDPQPEQAAADREPETEVPATIPSRSGPERDVDSITQPVSLYGVTPGITTLEEARESLGKPVQELRDQGMATLVYQREPFARIEISGRESVERIRIEFADPRQPAEALKELGVAAFVLTDCLNEKGEEIGLSVPERGVNLYYAADSRRDAVDSLSLEPIAPEPFLRRALWGNREAHLARLHDLEIASELKGDAARIAWVHSNILSDCGRLHDALESASRAVRQSAQDVPELFDYELTAARLAGEAGQHSRAMKEARRLHERSDLSADRRAEASCLLGSLTDTGPQPNAAKAMQLHQQALQLATPLLNSKQADARRRAKLVLWEAHLAIAREIALGSYQDKNDVVDKWLQNGRRITLDLVENETLGSAMQLSWYRKAIACYRAIGELDKVSRMTDEMLQLGQSLLANSKDSAFSQQVEWELSQSLSHAVTAAIDRGDDDEALRLAENGLGLLDASADQRELTPALKSVCGRLYFAIGTVHAAAKNDHAEGVRWYERALNCFPSSEDVSSGEMSEHGERLVSIGLTFWKAGKREQGMRLTKQGAQLVQRSVKSGVAPETSLAVPYGNLAFMHKQLGNEDESKSFAAMAAKIESKGSRRR